MASLLKVIELDKYYLLCYSRKYLMEKPNTFLCSL